MNSSLHKIRTFIKYPGQPERLSYTQSKIEEEPPWSQMNAEIRRLPSFCLGRAPPEGLFLHPRFGNDDA